jgi:hypothetical protein
MPENLPEYIAFVLLGLLIGLASFTIVFLLWLGSMWATNHPFLPV